MKLRLVYPREKVRDPVISQFVLQTEILVNILEAKVTATTGEMLIDVPASGAQLEMAISLLESAGIDVGKIPALIHIDPDRCISCGACVSPCPVEAITQNLDWSVQLDEAKCIRCLICVQACPVKAIATS